MKKIILITFFILSLFVLRAMPAGYAVTAGTITTTTSTSSAKHPMVIQGHSPIGILVTAPSEAQTGCSNGKNVTGIPNSTFSGCGTEPETVSVPDPVQGNWVVAFVGTGSGSFTINLITCNEKNSDEKNEGHSEICGQDPDDKKISSLNFTGTVTPGQSGSFSFVLLSNGQLMIPILVSEFLSFIPAVIPFLAGLGVLWVLRTRRSLAKA